MTRPHCSDLRGLALSRMRGVGLVLWALTWTSPAGATEAPPNDTQAEELAVAQAVHGAQPSVSADAGAPPGAQPSDNESAPETDQGPPPVEQLKLTELLAQSRRLTELLDDELNEDVDLTALLGVEPTDKAAIALQLRQWKAVLAFAQTPAERIATESPPATTASATAPSATTASATTASATTATDFSPSPASNPPAGQQPTPRQTEQTTSATLAHPSAPAGDNDLSSRLWSAQIELTRLRVKYFELPQADQTQLIANYQTRRTDRLKASSQAKQDIAAADERAQKAQRERDQALAEAEAATSEALKLLHQEEARLLSIKAEQANYEAQLLRRAEATQLTAESVLGWRRRVSEFLNNRDHQPADSADRLYDELRQQLRSARSRLSDKLSHVTSSESLVPSAGPDRLDTGGIQIDRKQYDALRQEVLTAGRSLREEGSRVTWQEATSLLRETEALNENRLLLFPVLSQDKRTRLTDFGSAGWDQAQAELTQVRLVLRYHGLATLSWVRDFDWRASGVFEVAWAKVAWFKLLLVTLLFWWWRRKGKAFLIGLELGLRKQRQRSPLQERYMALIDIYRKVRRPFEWLVLGWLVLRLLDPQLRDFLELRVAWIGGSWILGAATLVLWINAVASRRAAAAARGSDVSALRLRSLRVVARTVVVFGLILSLTTEFVGRGTLHTWVINSCGFAAVPIGLLLIHWWKPTIYERLTPRKNRNRLATWIVATQTGWRSFFAAAAGGIYLLALGAVRVGLDYLTELELVRHLLAYLFQRSMTHQALTTVHLAPIDASTQRALTSPSHHWVEPEDAAGFIKHVRATTTERGGVFAVVGEWGSGKSSILRRLSEQMNEAVTQVQCPSGGVSGFLEMLGAALKLSACPTSAALSEALQGRSSAVKSATAPLILIDDAHRLLSPTIGGIQQLEDILDAARQGGTFAWVFAFDHALFTLFERAYGLRPAFDDVLQLQPWSEEQLRELVEHRNVETNLEPSFRLLLPRIVRGDEIDRAEKVERTRTGYYRMLWNYSAGNPGVASYAWAHSLGIDDHGALCVGPFTSPATTDLESLPDTSCFVLRAVVRLELAKEDAIAQAANVSLDRVRSVLRYAKNKGYVQADEQRRLFISPHWFRAITRVLQRKHFLTTPS